MTLNPSYDYHANKGVLPGFVQPAQILRDALEVLEPTIDLSQTECATEFRIIDGMKYDKWLTPYMIEPMEATVNRRYKAAIFAGTVQSGKTTALVENTIMHRMICDPCDIHVTQMDKDAAALYSRGKIDKMLRESDQLREKQITRGDSLGNVFDKKFRGNATLTIGWPVAAKLASRDIPVMITTDRDRISDNISGEGDILPMMLARNTRFGSRAISIVESSPGRDIKDETWSPTTIHEAPPCNGIMGYYNSGTRGRYYWKCPNCKKRFEPDFKHLRYKDEGSSFERGQSVYMLCPAKKCGGVIEPGEKYNLNLPENGATWLHESKDGKRAVPLGHKNIRQADYVSWWQKGPVAAYQSWPEIVTQYLDALHEFETTGEETSLKAVVNTRMGLPYLSRMRETSLDLSGGKLSDRAEFRELGVAPKEAAFIIISIDVQPSRFVVSVVAYGHELEHWLVDRYDLAIPPKNSPGASRRGMQTNIYKEDWQVLNELHDQAIPIEGENYGLKPRAIIIDSGGAPGTTDKAYGFWRAKQRKRQAHIYHIYKGLGGWEAPRAKLRQPENQQGKKYLNRNAVKIVFTAANRLKDEVVASLVREEPGPSTFHLPEGLPKDVFDEFCAERREKDGWQKKPGHTRNESLDLAVMAKAVMIVIGAEKINWDKPVSWALASIENKYAVQLGDGNENAPKPENQKTGGAALAAARAKFIKN